MHSTEIGRDLVLRKLRESNGDFLFVACL